MDTRRLRASWALVAAHGAQVRKFFYARLFVAQPELRKIFPATMAGQSDRLIVALGRIVSNVDKLPAMLPGLEQLGRDHRRMPVKPEYYAYVQTALMATLQRFLGRDWTPELARDWAEAYATVAGVMVGAAAAVEGTTPPWWHAEVVEHERRAADLAVLRIRPEPSYPYRPGQSTQVEAPTHRFAWRPYSLANAPRADGTFDLHVRAVRGGLVSTALVESVTRGDALRLGEPVGTRLTLDEDSGRDLLMIAGGTGLAPFKAVIEDLAEAGDRRRVTLYLAARDLPDLYDLPALERMQAALPWLRVVPVLSHGPCPTNHRDNVLMVAQRDPGWATSDVFVCGPESLVSEAQTRFVAAGMPPDRIRIEDYYPDPYHLIARPPLAPAS